MHYFTLKDLRRPLEFLLRVLECWKPQNEPISKISKKFWKISKGGTLGIFFFSFIFNTLFYSVIPNETIRMSFRGLTMTKSSKLTKKGGLCYRFAIVNIQHLIMIRSLFYLIIIRSVFRKTNKFDLWCLSQV